MSSWPIFHLYLFLFVAFTQCSEITCDSKIASNWNTIMQEMKALRSCQRLFLTFQISGIPLKFITRVYFVSPVSSIIFLTYFSTEGKYEVGIVSAQEKQEPVCKIQVRRGARILVLNLSLRFKCCRRNWLEFMSIYLLSFHFRCEMMC